MFCQVDDSNELDHRTKWALLDFMESTGVHQVFEKLPPNLAVESDKTRGHRLAPGLGVLQIYTVQNSTLLLLTHVPEHQPIGRRRKL